MLYHFFFLVIFFTFYTLSLSSSPLITKELLDGFFDSFNRHDVDGVLSYMSEDCEFHAIAGDADQKLGKTFSGLDEIRAAFAATFKSFPDAQWIDSVHHIFPNSDTAFSESTFVATSYNSNQEKQRVQARMIDVLKFNNEGKITMKNAFRKNIPFQVIKD